jgi:hypothetical protein
MSEEQLINMQHEASDAQHPLGDYNSPFSEEQLTEMATEMWGVFGIELDPNHINISDDYATSIGVLTHDPTTFADDYLDVSTKQLADLHINDSDAARFLFAHEAAHCIFQNSLAFENNPWMEELACDYFAGVISALKGFNLDGALESLSHTHADTNHPVCKLRTDLAEFGEKIVLEFKEQGIDFTLQNFMEKFYQYCDSEAQTINDAHDSVISSMNEEINGHDDDESLKKGYGQPCDTKCAFNTGKWTDRKDFGRG